MAKHVARLAVPARVIPFVPGRALQLTTAKERFVAFRRSLPRTPPLERQTVRIRGLTFAVFSTPPVGDADAPPLLCINGGMLYDHAMLWPAMSPLARTRQVILYDQRGRGQSEAPPVPAAATIEDDAGDIAALRRGLGIRRWDLLGHSWGGGIAMLAASLDEAGTRRLVTVDAVGPTNAWMTPLRAAVGSRLRSDDRSAFEAFAEPSLAEPDPDLQAAYARAVYPAWFRDPELAQSFAPPKVTSVTGAAILARLRRDGYDWRARLSALSVPTLVIHGEDDVLPLAVSVELAALLPRAKRVLVPHSGHMPFWEAPQVFFPAVESFLAAPLSGAVRREV
jgi:proline iminopeptidase